jgi:hypothetical protein
MHNLKQALLAILGILFCVAIFSTVYIHLSYGAKMPKDPQPEVGRTYQITVNHGTRVYVTKQELERAEFVFRTMPYVAIICFAAFGIIKFYFKDS